MKRLIFWFLTIELCNCLTVVTTTMSSVNKTNKDYPTICDTPPSDNIDPEKCCKFPKIFNESEIMACEDKGISSTDDLITDSCVIECMFNKSMHSKLNREGMLSFVLNHAKSNDDVWKKSLIKKAIDTCFNEHDDMSEIIENIRKENGPKLICNPKASLILDCFYRELFKVCPAKKFANDLPDCKILKKFATTCDDW